MWMAAHSIAQKGKSQSAVAAIGEIGAGAEISLARSVPTAVDLLRKN